MDEEGFLRRLLQAEAIVQLSLSWAAPEQLLLLLLPNLQQLSRFGKLAAAAKREPVRLLSPSAALRLAATLTQAAAADKSQRKRAASAM